MPTWRGCQGLKLVCHLPTPCLPSRVRPAVIVCCVCMSKCCIPKAPSRIAFGSLRILVVADAWLTSVKRSYFLWKSNIGQQPFCANAGVCRCQRDARRPKWYETPGGAPHPDASGAEDSKGWLGVVTQTIKSKAPLEPAYLEGGKGLTV